MRRPVILLIALILLGTAATVDHRSITAAMEQPGSADKVRAEFEAIASKLHFFAAERFLYGGMLPSRLNEPDFLQMRQSIGQPITETERFLDEDLKVIGPGFWPTYDPDTLLPLLKHANPKVRTLAAAALAVSDPIRFAAAIEPLQDDDAATFPRVEYFDPSRPVPPAAQSVADVALRLCGGRIEPQRLARLDEWRRATGRRFTCQELLWQLDRALRAKPCFPAEAAARINAIEQEMRELPMPDRVWYRIAAERGPTIETGYALETYDLATEGELVALAGQLSHDQLIDALRRRIATTDPTIQPVRDDLDQRSPWQDSIRRFILDHADQLLRASDIAFLLFREWVEPQYTGLKGPIWAIAAARIEPQRAREFLLPALERFSLDEQRRERLAIVLALREIDKEAPVRFYVDWFYALPCRHLSDADEIARYSRKLAAMRRPDGSMLVAAIVRDPRFESTSPRVLEELNRILVERLGRDHVLADFGGDTLSHPQGRAHLWWELDEAMEKYPDETRVYLEALAKWRRQIRESVPAYLDAPSEP